MEKQKPKNQSTVSFTKHLRLFTKFFEIKVMLDEQQCLQAIAELDGSFKIDINKTTSPVTFRLQRSRYKERPIVLEGTIHPEPNMEISYIRGKIYLPISELFAIYLFFSPFGCLMAFCGNAIVGEKTQWCGTVYALIFLVATFFMVISPFLENGDMLQIFTDHLREKETK